MNLPATLNRKAIIETFDKFAPVTWEKLFEREDQNGIGKLRTEGDYPGKAYYVTSGIMEWLIRNGHYTVDEFKRNPKCGGESTMQGMPRRIAAFGL